MTLTELRSRLEEFEREGYGQRSIGVIPAMPADDDWNKTPTDQDNMYQPDFVIMHYVVSDVSLCPVLDNGPVNLVFTEGGDMRAARELVDGVLYW